jgi:hypothetical protein
MDTWTEQKYLKRFEMWFWKRMEKISWTDHVRNGEVLHRVKEDWNILQEQTEGMLIGLVTPCIGTVF